MAGRLWTKGVAWKKAAVSLLTESQYGGNLSALDYCNQRSFIGERGSNIDAFSHGRETTLTNAFRRKSLSNIREFPTTVGDRTMSAKRYRGGILQTLADNQIFQQSNSFRGDIQRQFGRSYSTSNTSGDFSDGLKTEAPKVGAIISSMFTEEAKIEQSKEENGKKEKDQEKGGKEEEKTENPFLRSQRFAKWMLIGTFAFSTPLFIYEFGPPKKDEMGNVIPDDFSDEPLPTAYAKRAWNEVMSMKKDIVEPSSQKLLPDPMQPPYYQPPYTLVIELFDVLLHPVYDQVHGWRFKKRPGIDYFLENIGPPLYEIVIFTRETGMTAYPLIDSMDPKGYIMYRLFRDAARFKSGFKMGDISKGEWPKLDPYYQKDLTYLNRDLSRVVVVDNDRRATELQPSNGISLKPWDGTSTDTELFDLAAFLRTIATNEVDDVRPVLEHYRKYEDPLAAFKLAQLRMQEEQQKLAKELQENKGRSFLMNPKGGGSGFSMLTNFFKSRN